MILESKKVFLSKKNLEFRKLIQSRHGAEKIMSCYQCGTCTSDCPIAKRIPEFNPRRIARLAMYGIKDELLAGDTLWLCAGCYTCYERCPEKVRVSELISALRSIALEEGILHPTFKALFKTIYSQGYIYEIGEFENEMREESGLPRAPEPNIDEIRAVIQNTNIQKIMGGKFD